MRRRRRLRAWNPEEPPPRVRTVITARQIAPKDARPSWGTLPKLRGPLRTRASGRNVWNRQRRSRIWSRRRRNTAGTTNPVALTTPRTVRDLSFSNRSGTRNLGGRTQRCRPYRPKVTGRLEMKNARSGPKKHTATHGCTLRTKNTWNGPVTRTAEAKPRRSRRAVSGKAALTPLEGLTNVGRFRKRPPRTNNTKNQPNRLTPNLSQNEK